MPIARRTRSGIAWREAGTGPALLLLHGLPDHSAVWNGVARRLAPAWRCVAPDLPGFGESTPTSSPRTLDDFRTTTAGLIEAADMPARFALVAHDVGGLYAVAWAIAHPKRVTALVLLNTSIFADRRWHWGARLLRTPGLGAAALWLIDPRSFRRELKRASASGLDERTIACTFRAFGPDARRAARALYRAQTPALLDGLPERVRGLTAAVPTLVLWGTRDPYLPPAFAERFGTTRLHRHDDLGHWPHAEASARVAREIRSFLLSPQTAPPAET